MRRQEAQRAAGDRAIDVMRRDRVFDLLMIGLRCLRQIDDQLLCMDLNTQNMVLDEGTVIHRRGWLDVVPDGADYQGFHVAGR